MLRATKPVIGIPAHVNNEGPNNLSCYATRTSYVEAIQAHGGLAVGLPPGDDAVIDGYLDLVDGILIPGGTDVDPACYGQPPHPTLRKLDPLLDRLEMRLIPLAVDEDMPVLAICRGIQVMSVALGGSLVQDLPSEREIAGHNQGSKRQLLAHEIRLDGSSRLGELLATDRISVNSLHHQAVSELPPSLTGTAWSEDGVLEAAEAPERRFVIALQCHPEELWNSTEPRFSRLFEAFVDACRSTHARRSSTPVSTASVRA